MAKPPIVETSKIIDQPLDPRGGDAILKRMLKTKPKTHEEMVKERQLPVQTTKPGAGAGKKR